MDETLPRMTNLFLQLGLDASEQAIAQFIDDHQLPRETGIAEASCWNEGQRQFLREKLESDGVWAIVIDQLNESLHEDATRASIED
ncbi:MAG: DUF2789 domain-containing protein [Stenotrophomonas sp.]